MTKKKNILVIDDEIDMCEALRDFLTDKGYVVSLCTEGEKALEMARKLFPDIIILDIKMPGMDGLKVLEELKKFDKDTKAFIITAYGDVDTAKEALELGAIACINKPFDGSKIIDLIEKTTGG